jgi:spermidine synthase
MAQNDGWFSELVEDIGTGFSLKIRRKLHEEQTPYQKLEIYDTETFGRLMILDGCTMVSTRDNFLYHEMMVHPVLFSHPAPKNVVIIGGGDCGTLREVLKHAGVSNAWQIEIDERVTRNAEQYFPELCESNGDPRARLVFEDGIAWIENAAQGSLDVIIVDSTDPVGPAEGLFREPFFRACRRALGPDGLLVQQSESPLVHAEKIIYPLHRTMHAAGFADTRTIFFPMPLYPTGWWSATMAGKKTIAFAREPEARKLAFETEYYTADIHTAAFAEPAFFKRKIKN